jgi:hypothetical protein
MTLASIGDRIWYNSAVVYWPLPTKCTSEVYVCMHACMHGMLPLNCVMQNRTVSWYEGTPDELVRITVFATAKDEVSLT